MRSPFAAGALDVVNAPQILDEGVDVTAADTSVILAANRSRRQMIQRMGMPDGSLCRRRRQAVHWTYTI